MGLVDGCEIGATFARVFGGAASVVAGRIASGNHAGIVIQHVRRIAFAHIGSDALAVGAFELALWVASAVYVFIALAAYWFAFDLTCRTHPFSPTASLGYCFQDSMRTNSRLTLMQYRIDDHEVEYNKNKSHKVHFHM